MSSFHAGLFFEAGLFFYFRRDCYRSLMPEFLTERIGSIQIR